MVRATTRETATRTRRKPVEGVTSSRVGSTRATRSTPKVENMFDPMAHIDDQLDAIEKDFSLSGSSMNSSEERLHTGMLVIDLILGKGILPGWYTLFGPEQSCKSTGANTIMGAALDSDVPILSLWDFEGSTSPDYLSNILKVQGSKTSVQEVFGQRDNNGNWVIRPRVRYYSEGVAEKFFDYLASLERRLPNKVKMEDQWYYVYENNKESKRIVGDHYDKKYFSRTNKYRIPAPDGTLQALVIVDSYPAMLPERLDVEDPGSGMAAQARMFSEQLKRVKGKLRSKRIAVVGINQLRKAPMVMYGPSEYEPAGEAVKYFSDARLRLYPRALSAIPGAKGKGMIEEETSIDGGTDTYRYIHVRAHKNKLSVPNLEGWLRLWITNSNGDAMGLDPVFDTWMYLQDTGQAVGKRHSFKLDLSGKGAAKKSLNWMDLKLWVLGTRKEMAEVCRRLGYKPFDLRAFCKRQLSKQNGIDLYFEHKKKAPKEEKEADSNE